MNLRKDALDPKGRCRAIKVEELINEAPEAVAWHVAALECELRKIKFVLGKFAMELKQSLNIEKTEEGEGDENQKAD